MNECRCSLTSLRRHTENIGGICGKVRGDPCGIYSRRRSSLCIWIYLCTSCLAGSLAYIQGSSCLFIRRVWVSLLLRVLPLTCLWRSVGPTRRVFEKYRAIFIVVIRFFLLFDCGGLDALKFSLRARRTNILSLLR